MKVNLELADHINKTSTKTNLFLLLERLSTTLLVVRNFLTFQKTRIRLPSKDNYHENTSIHKLNKGHKIIQIFYPHSFVLFWHQDYIKAVSIERKPGNQVKYQNWEKFLHQVRI